MSCCRLFAEDCPPPRRNEEQTRPDGHASRTSLPHSDGLSHVRQGAARARFGHDGVLTGLGLAPMTRSGKPKRWPPSCDAFAAFLRLRAWPCTVRGAIRASRDREEILEIVTTEDCECDSNILSRTTCIFVCSCRFTRNCDTKRQIKNTRSGVHQWGFKASPPLWMYIHANLRMKCSPAIST